MNKDGVTSFVKELFFGNIHEELVYPFPEQDKDTLESIKIFSDSLAKYLKDNVNAAAIDAEGKIPDSVMQGLKELGMFGLIIPEEYGGFGLNSAGYCKVMEVVSSVDPSLTVTLGAHQSIGLKALLLFGNDQQKKKYLPKLATGEWVAAFALTEPGSGSDAGSIQTTAKLSEDGKFYVLNGSKLWITNGGFASFFTVFAKTGDKISAFAVERSFEGVSNGPEEHKLGIKGSSTTAVYFDNVKVPVENLIGEQGKGFKVAMEVLNSGRLGLAAGCVGGAKKIIEMATLQATTRKQFNRPISSFEMIQDKIGRMVMDTYAMESMTYMTAGLNSRGVQDYSIEGAICKVWCSEKIWSIVNEALQIAAGLGYMKEYPYERIMRDTRINMIFEGTNEILRLFIALAGIQGPGNKLKDFSRALQDPIKGFGVLRETITPLAKPWIFADNFTKEAEELKGEAGLLEKAIQSLATTAEKLAYRYGRTIDVPEAPKGKNTEIVEREFAQKRLSEMVMEIYAMTCVISRATAAIQKKGAKEASRELTIAKAFVKESERKVRRLLEEMDDNIDASLKMLSQDACQSKLYNFSHL